MQSPAQEASEVVFLWVFLQATQEELKASYRRLCMLYHPDKHRDPELKLQAEQLFNLVHQAYEGKQIFLCAHVCPRRKRITFHHYSKCTS